jgi:hypothetical protein
MFCPADWRRKIAPQIFADEVLYNLRTSAQPISVHLRVKTEKQA